MRLLNNYEWPLRVTRQATSLALPNGSGAISGQAHNTGLNTHIGDHSKQETRELTPFKLNNLARVAETLVQTLGSALLKP